MPDGNPQLSPYPFTIAPVHYPDNKASKLNVWNVQEFFRIELLLRSQTIQTIYRIGATGPESTIVLGFIYGMTWDVLQGSHHRYLRDSSRVETIPGFSMMTFQELGSRLETLHKFLSTQPEEFKTQLFKNLHARFLGLMIDPAIPPKTVLSAIRPTLEERHKTSTPARMKKPYPFDVPTWLGYLSCYDLRVAQACTFGQIAKHVYGLSAPKPRDRAEKAVRRTQRFIGLAESMSWPPSTQSAAT